MKNFLEKITFLIKKDENEKLDKKDDLDKKENKGKKKKIANKKNSKKKKNLEKKKNSDKKGIGTYKEIAGYILLIIVGLLVAQHMNVVVSESMEPVFYRGDIVIIEKTNFLGINEFNPENVNIGDIVVYNAEWYPNPVIHRVINKTNINGTNYFTIKGDNNEVPDPYLVEPSQITDRVLTIGEHPLIIPKIGYITIWLKGL